MAAKNGEFLIVNELTGKTLCMNCQSFDDQGLQFLFFWLHRQRMNYNVLLHKFWEVVGWEVEKEETGCMLLHVCINIWFL